MSLVNSNSYIEPVAGSTLNASRLQYNSSLRSILSNFKSTSTPTGLNIVVDGNPLGEVDGMLYRSAKTNALYISDSVHVKSAPVGGKFTRIGIGNRVENGIQALAANATSYEIGELVATVSQNGTIAANSRLYLCVSNTAVAGSANSFIDVGSPLGYTVGTNDNVSFSGQSVSAIRYIATSNIAVGTSSPSQSLHVEGNQALNGDLLMFGQGTSERRIEVGIGRTSNAASYIDLIGDPTYTDFGTRLIRNGGVNGVSEIRHRGTGALRLDGLDSCDIAFRTASTERMRINSIGRVGIKTITPSTTFEVVGDGADGINLGPDSTNQNASSRLFFSNVITGQSVSMFSSSGNLVISTRGNTGVSSGTSRVVINSDGKVGIGTNAPTSNLQVVGTVTATDFNSSSDYRLKKDVVTISNALNTINSINSVQFTWKDNEARAYGVIAQEIEQILPSIVVEGNDSYKYVAYQQLVPILIAAVKELTTEVNYLKEQINAS